MRTLDRARPSGVAGRGTRTLDSLRVIRKLNKVYLIHDTKISDFFKPPHIVVSLAAKVSPVGEHGGAISAKKISVRYATSLGRQETLAASSRKLPMCRVNSPTVV